MPNSGNNLISINHFLEGIRLTCQYRDRLEAVRILQYPVARIKPAVILVHKLIEIKSRRKPVGLRAAGITIMSDLLVSPGIGIDKSTCCISNVQ